jgi:hypothetical protein
MYCLTFSESGEETQTFYFNNFCNASKMQRDLLIIEINNIVKNKCGENPFDLDELQMSNYELHRMLNVLIRLTHGDDYIDNIISVTVESVFFEDEPTKLIDLIE